MKKVKKLSLTDLVLYGLVFMVPIAPVSLYGVVYNLSHGMVALVYIIGAIAMFFTAYSLLPGDLFKITVIRRDLTESVVIQGDRKKCYSR